AQCFSPSHWSGPAGWLHAGGWQSLPPSLIRPGGRCPGKNTGPFFGGAGGLPKEMIAPAVKVAGGAVGPCGAPGPTMGPDDPLGGAVGPCGVPGPTMGP